MAKIVLKAKPYSGSGANTTGLFLSRGTFTVSGGTFVTNVLGDGSDTVPVNTTATRLSTSFAGTPGERASIGVYTTDFTLPTGSRIRYCQAYFVGRKTGTDDRSISLKLHNLAERAAGGVSWLTSTSHALSNNWTTYYGDREQTAVGGKPFTQTVINSIGAEIYNFSTTQTEFSELGAVAEYDLKPTVTILTPQIVYTPSPTITWDYQDDYESQKGYQVEIRDANNDLVFSDYQSDNGLRSSTVNKALPNGDYSLRVRASQIFQIPGYAEDFFSDWVTSTFTIKTEQIAAPTVTVATRTTDGYQEGTVVTVYPGLNMLNAPTADMQDSQWTSSLTNATLAMDQVTVDSGTSSLKLTAVATGNMSTNTGQYNPVGSGAVPAYGFAFKSIPGQVSSAQVDISTTDHSAFPHMIKLANNNLVTVWRQGTSHASGDGIIYRSISTDAGVTWGAPAVVAGTGTPDHRDPNLVQIANGNVLCSYFKSGTSSSFLKISTDGGSTWGSEITISTAYGASSGPIVQHPVSGALFWAGYGAVGNNFVRLMTSTNNGSTWTQVNYPLGPTLGEQFGVTHWQEPVMYFEGTNLYMMVRTNNAQWVVRGTSTDAGATWSYARLPFTSDSRVNTVKLTNGNRYFFSRQYPDFKYLVTRVSTTNGSTVSPPFLVDEAPFRNVYSGPVEVTTNVIGLVYAGEYSDYASSYMRFKRLTPATPVNVAAKIDAYDRTGTFMSSTTGTAVTESVLDWVRPTVKYTVPAGQEANIGYFSVGLVYTSAVINQPHFADSATLAALSSAADPIPAWSRGGLLFPSLNMLRPGDSDFEDPSYWIENNANTLVLTSDELKGIQGEYDLKVTTTEAGMSRVEGGHIAGPLTAATRTNVIATTFPNRQNNDIGFYFFSWSANPGTVTAPAGWTQLGVLTATGTNTYSAVYYRVIDGTETANYVWNWTNSVEYHVARELWRGVDTSNPFISGATPSVSTAASATITPASVTLGVNRGVIMFVSTSWATASPATTYTHNITGTTQRASTGSTADGYWIGTRLATDPANTNPAQTGTITASRALNGYVSWSIVLRPKTTALLSTRIEDYGPPMTVAAGDQLWVYGAQGTGPGNGTTAEVATSGRVTKFVINYYDSAMTLLGSQDAVTSATSTGANVVMNASVVVPNTVGIVYASPALTVANVTNGESYHWDLLSVYKSTANLGYQPGRYTDGTVAQAYTVIVYREPNETSYNLLGSVPIKGSLTYQPNQEAVTGLPATIQFPGKITFYDLEIASGLTRYYSAYNTAVDGALTFYSAFATEAANTITFKQTWIHAVDNVLATSKHYTFDGYNASDTTNNDVAEIKLTGRNYPVAQYAKTSKRQFSKTIMLQTAAEKAAMEVIRKKKGPIVLRDGRGRRFQVAITGMTYTDQKADHVEVRIDGFVVWESGNYEL